MVGSEKDPGKIGKDEGQGDFAEAAAEITGTHLIFFDDFFPDRCCRVFDHLIKSVYASPDNIGPVGSMPKTADQEGQHKVTIFFELRAAASSKRYVDIVSQPCA